MLVFHEQKYITFTCHSDSLPGHFQWVQFSLGTPLIWHRTRSIIDIKNNIKIKEIQSTLLVYNFLSKKKIDKRCYIIIRLKNNKSGVM